MRDTEPPDTIPSSQMPELDIGALVVQKIIREEMPPIVNAALEPVRETLEGIADRVLEKIQTVSVQLSWVQETVRENASRIDDHDQELEQIKQRLLDLEGRSMDAQ